MSVSLPVSLLLVLLSLPGGSSLVCSHEEDVPGASLYGQESSQLPVVELKCWLKNKMLQQLGRSGEQAVQ